MAKIDALAAERNILARVGTCHFNDSTNSAGIQVFLDQWDCFSDASQPSLKKIPLIVTGDSHSADKVMALKLNGYVPLQIGGAGCSLNPRFMTKECKLIFDKLYQSVINDDYYKFIAIANRFESEDEVSIDSIRETIEYWERFRKKIIFFTAMPEFYLFRESIAGSFPLEADFKFSRISERDAIKEYLNSHGVHIVITRKIFCSISGFKDDNGNLLLIGSNHLSKTGAKLFGRNMLQQDKLLKAITD